MSLETISITDVRVLERFRKELGDIKTLAQSIQEVGLLQPIVIDQAGQLVAGRRRLEACKVLGWKTIPVHRVNLSDIAKGEFHENAVRKNFTASEIVAIKRAIEPTVRKEARKRQGRRTDIAKALPAESAESRETISEYVGISHDTLAKIEKAVIAAEKDPARFGSILQKLDHGELSVNKAFSMIRQTETPSLEPATEKMKKHRSSPAPTATLSDQSPILSEKTNETTDKARERTRRSENARKLKPQEESKEPERGAPVVKAQLPSTAPIQCPNCGTESAELVWKCCGIPFRPETQDAHGFASEVR